MEALVTWQQRQPRVCAPFLAAAESGRLHHAYLLVDRRRGAAQIAQSMATALLCRAAVPMTDRPCGSCAPCRKVVNGNHPDFFVLRPNDKGTVPIDAVRELLPSLYLRPAEADRKVVVIDGADAMTAAAQNSLLKTLEEPPGAANFFLATVRPKTLLPTIRSRVVQLVFSYPTADAASAHLESAGVAPHLATALAPLVGDDAERALQLASGADELLQPLQGVLAGRLSASELLHLAEELGGDAERSALALALIEVAVRNALAGGDASTAPRAGKAAARLQAMRRMSVYNPNRTMAFEGLFLELAGCLNHVISAGRLA